MMSRESQVKSGEKLLPDIHRRIVNAKYVFERAVSIQNENNEMSLSIALLLTHDAIELLMLAVLDHVQAASKKRRDFMDFWPDMKQAGKADPPDFMAMEALNKLRVGLKHNGNVPNPKTVHELMPRARGFFENVLSAYCGLQYKDVSLLDRIEDVEVRDLLKGARTKFESDRAGAMTDLKIAMHKIEHPNDKILPMMHAPKAPSLPNEMNRAGWGDYMETLHNFLDQCAIRTNALSLGFDPIEYRFFLQFGPIVQWSFTGQPTVQHRSDYEHVTAEVFNEFVEFLVDYALKSSEAYLPIAD